MYLRKSAEVIKEYLVNLAIEGKLPLDLNELNVEEMKEVIRNGTRVEVSVDVASNYLSDCEFSVLEQIKAIVAHKDQSDYIDNVEGVLAWEKVEFTFTCEEFLDMINWPF